MDELYIGLAVICAAAYGIRWVFIWRQYKNSVYQALYTGYMEYWMKRKKIRKLSVSDLLTEEIGPHRIYYQLCAPEAGKYPQLYVVVTLSSGLYVIQAPGANEKPGGTEVFTRKFLNKTGKKDLPVFQLIAVPDRYQSAVPQKRKIELVKYSQLCEKLAGIHREQKQVLDEKAILNLWEDMAGESLKADE